jgi:hypothetical protein
MMECLNLRAWMHKLLEDRPLGLSVFAVLALVASATAMILATSQDSALQHLIF